MIQHDMMLFDHGMPRADGTVSKEQRPEADVNIEFQSQAKQAEGAQKLAWALYSANESLRDRLSGGRRAAHDQHRLARPSWISFRRSACARTSAAPQIGAGWDPHWHQPTDVYATFSDADFRLGLNAAQTTLGAVARLTGASLAAGSVASARVAVAARAE